MQGPGLASTPWCQRWQSGKPSWRHPNESAQFSPGRYTVANLTEHEAKRFCAEHHYLGSAYPASIHRLGMQDRSDGRLVGAAIYSAPVHERVLRLAFPDLTPYAQSVELGRFVLLDEVPANAESWLLARTFSELRSRGVKGVVSFADPMPRRGPAGEVVAGHTGVIYQATNAIYTGRGTPRTLIVLPDGSVLNGRSAQKIRRLEQGHRYVEARLRALGARPLRSGEDTTRWLREALDTVQATRIRHHGPHRYLFPLGRTRRDRDRVRLGLASRPYPKRADETGGRSDRQEDWPAEWESSQQFPVGMSRSCR